MSLKIELLINEQPDALMRAAAERFVDVAHQSITERGRFIVALAGGSTPRTLYELLASEEWRERVEWDKTLVVFGDERAVSPDDEQSNYRMARQSLLEKTGILSRNVYRMRGEDKDLEAAARDYEAQLREMGAPLDLALLGMGEDGHTASLFPHTSTLEEKVRWCVATDVAPLEPHVRRLTLTYPVFNAARHVFILATGAGKAQRVAAALQGERDVKTMPVQGIQPQNGQLTWMLDTAAAGLLDDSLKGPKQEDKSR